VLAGALLMQPGSAQDESWLPRPARAVNHIGIVVADYAAAYQYYTENLGLTEAYTVERNGAPLLTYLQLNRETFVELIPARAGQATGVSHFGMEVADIDATVARLREHGVEVSDPGVTPANARFVRVRDADNVEIEIMEFGPESSQYQAMRDWQ
jgi:catechol 2,3-dioxygenase-like lactoylglutathione lyase family enzyme